MFTAHFYPGLADQDHTVIEANHYSVKQTPNGTVLELKRPLPASGVDTYTIKPHDRVYIQNSQGHQIEIIEGKAATAEAA